MDKKKDEGNSMNSNGKTQLVIVFLVGFLLGLLVGPTFGGDNAEKTDEDGTPSEVEMTEKVDENGDIIETPNNTTPSNSSVEVEDQLAGDRVRLGDVSLENEAWVVVHESIDGVPTNALGAQRLDAGVHTGKYVDLLRSTETDKTYFVILYGENGDGEFSRELDKPLTGTDNTLISETFKTIQVNRKN